MAYSIYSDLENPASLLVSSQTTGDAGEGERDQRRCVAREEEESRLVGRGFLRPMRRLAAVASLRA
jgi:hypothetical protein